MLVRGQNRKNKKYLRYVGIVFLVFGISLILVSSFILFSPYLFSKKLISPLPSKNIFKNLDIKSILIKEKIDFSEVYSSTDSAYVVNLKEGGRVIFSTKKDLLSQVRSLQIILSRLTIDGKKLRALDFRFDKPVVSY